jgi:hypothetical protein
MLNKVWKPASFKHAEQPIQPSLSRRTSATVLLSGLLEQTPCAPTPSVLPVVAVVSPSSLPNPSAVPQLTSPQVSPQGSSSEALDDSQSQSGAISSAVNGGSADTGTTATSGRSNLGGCEAPSSEGIRDLRSRDPHWSTTIREDDNRESSAHTRLDFNAVAEVVVGAVNGVVVGTMAGAGRIMDSVRLNHSYPMTTVDSDDDSGEDSEVRSAASSVALITVTADAPETEDGDRSPRGSGGLVGADAGNAQVMIDSDEEDGDSDAAVGRRSGRAQRNAPGVGCLHTVRMRIEAERTLALEIAADPGRLALLPPSSVIGYLMRALYAVADNYRNVVASAALYPDPGETDGVAAGAQPVTQPQGGLSAEPEQRRCNGIGIRTTPATNVAEFATPEPAPADGAGLLHSTADEGALAEYVYLRQRALGELQTESDGLVSRLMSLLTEDLVGTVGESFAESLAESFDMGLTQGPISLSEAPPPIALEMTPGITSSNKDEVAIRLSVADSVVSGPPVGIAHEVLPVEAKDDLAGRLRHRMEQQVICWGLVSR